MIHQNLEIKILKDIETAKRVGEFLISSDAFEQITWAPNEKKFVRQAPVDSISGKNIRYWYVEKEGEIIGAMGVRENKYGSGGYEMDLDYVAVHRRYRRHGLATNLLKKVEEYITKRGGRYLHILTCDSAYYEPARKFYEKNRYKKVAEIPDYYVENEGRIDYFKQF